MKKNVLKKVLLIHEIRTGKKKTSELSKSELELLKDQIEDLKVEEERREKIKKKRKPVMDDSNFV